MSDYGNNNDAYFNVAYNMCHIETIKDFINKCNYIPFYFEIKNDPIYKEINDIILNKFEKTKYESSTIIYTFF